MRLATFVGGALFGMGLMVLAQVQVVRALQREVGQAGFLGRSLGRLTFPWRSIDEKLAFAADSVPVAWLDTTHSSGMGLAVGGIAVGYCLPFAIRAWWWFTQRRRA
ncbi:MAG: hypothetical protein WD226_03005 [Planctomycetota bacterium]